MLPELLGIKLNETLVKKYKENFIDIQVVDIENVNHLLDSCVK